MCFCWKISTKTRFFCTKSCNLAIQHVLSKSSVPFYEKLNPYVSPMVSESIQGLSIREGSHSNVVNTKAANVWQIKSSKYFWASKMTKFIKDSNYRSIKVLRINHCQKITLEFIKGCQISWHYQLETQIFNGHIFKDYQHIVNYTKYGLNFVTQANVSCCVYDIQMLDAKPSLKSNFIHDLEDLSDEYVEYIYRK